MTHGVRFCTMQQGDKRVINEVKEVREVKEVKANSHVSFKHGI